MDRKRNDKNRHPMFGVLAITMVVALLGIGAQARADDPIITHFHTVTQVQSTIPANGDLNPYGVAQVQRSVGSLVKGHILVSNFNNSQALGNLEGTGSTIVDIAPDGTFALFSQLNPANLPGSCPGGLGLTTALVVLKSGWVIVGSVPTTDGLPDTVQPGCLIVLDSSGNPVETFYGSLLNGPWDMAALEDQDEDAAQLFVTTVLNGVTPTTLVPVGTVVNGGTVVRINLNLPKGGMPSIESMTVIGSGFPEVTNNTTLVVGPTGVGMSPQVWGEERVLYVADTVNNRIAVIPDAVDRTTSAGTGFTLTSNGSLNGPLGLTVAPNGHILTVNGGDGFITEITPGGKQVAKFQLDNTVVPGEPNGNGTLFGLTFDPVRGVFFVDNGTNTLNLFH
jgi:hypothetical protein